MLTSKQRTIKQTKNGSNTEATLILCGYSGERANNRGDSTKERRMRRRKIRKFAYRQTDREQFKNLGHSNPLWIVGGAGQLVYSLPSEAHNLATVGM